MTPPEWQGANFGSAAVLEGGSATPWEKEYLRKDGTRLPMLVGVAMLDHHRNITVVTDLTEQKRAERRLGELAASDG